jgi:diaminopimelate epimerase
MMRNFVKYHSLGNDFVIIDWLEKPIASLREIINHKDWSTWVVDVCKRHTGVGADGILIIQGNAAGEVPEVLIYNADGSLGQTCLNGLRAVSQYLVVHRNLPATFKIQMGQRMYSATVGDGGLVTTLIQPAQVHNQLQVDVDSEKFDGHVVSIGNPHYINFRSIDLEFLRRFGPQLESHPAFPLRSNVEFVWQDCHREDLYHLLVYERGCGITNACSSGAAATLWLLYERGVVRLDSKIIIAMLGGEVTGWVSSEGIYLQAPAVEVFSGVLTHDL